MPLLMQGTQVRPLVREDPARHGARDAPAVRPAHCTQRVVLAPATGERQAQQQRPSTAPINKYIFFLNPCVSRSVVSDSLLPPGLYPTRLLCPWNSPGNNTAVSSRSLLQGSSQPRDQPRSAALQAGSLPSESPGKPPRNPWFHGIQFPLGRMGEN